MWLVFLKVIDNLRRKKQQHGLSNTIDAFALKALNAAFGLKFLRGVCIANPDASFLQCPAAYRAGFLSAAQLRAFEGGPARNGRLRRASYQAYIR